MVLHRCAGDILQAWKSYLARLAPIVMVPLTARKRMSSACCIFHCIPPEMFCKRASTTAMLPEGYGILAGWQCSSYRYPAVDTRVWTEVVHSGGVVWRMPPTGAANWCVQGATTKQWVPHVGVEFDASTGRES